MRDLDFKKKCCTHQGGPRSVRHVGLDPEERVLAGQADALAEKAIDIVLTALVGQHRKVLARSVRYAWRVIHGAEESQMWWKAGVKTGKARTRAQASGVL
jgi:hypothetical protein